MVQEILRGVPTMEPTKNEDSQLTTTTVVSTSWTEPSVTSVLYAREPVTPIKQEPDYSKLEKNLPDDTHNANIEDSSHANEVKMESETWETEDSYIKHEMEIGPTKLQQYYPPSSSAQAPTTDGNPNPKSDPTKPFACDLCDAKYSRISALNIHKRQHSGDKPFRCNKCDRRFVHHSQLTVHMRRHTNERFICEICEAKFTYSGGLNAHMREHSGDKPYKCDQCDNSYINMSKLNSHRRKHGDKRLACEHCDSKFSHSSSLKTHIKRKHV